MNRRQWLATAGAAALGGMACRTGLAAAPAYPSRPIRLIVPFIAGTAPDASARSLAAELGPLLGQSVVVENIGGAGGIIGARALKRAEPDGYTLGVLANQHVINVHLYRDPPYDATRDFTPITTVSGGPVVLAVPAASPYRTARELVDAMKRQPGALNYGSGGKGSVAHLAVESLLHQTRTEAVHIPYKGASEIVTAMVSGQTQFGMPVLSTAAPFLRNGQIRPLAVSSAARSVYFPDVPTLAEALPPGFVLDNWSGVFAPAGLPPALTKRLFDAIATLQASGKLDASTKANSGELRKSASPAQFAQMVAAENARYGKLIAEIGMRGEAG
ncbi:tripartite tricarboxylate transporter substrate-binding protein [Cupriavidus sp. SZY C1]|uniref:tripartite tricarboxylate transporter substrate-binding protein n=1 Tax=Cupriavidus sp. SZY C1 TaxID=3055037 RepID=UPI0028B9071A|nr:tripartite tricarboxylate transporter substrate-binding protein [Cupriavidus sp. SZY C1]MDT6963645.1 tripartite tricarboxylate transporter substrate-binding protein [Cupriavidus sp. SZY C1]